MKEVVLSLLVTAIFVLLSIGGPFLFNKYKKELRSKWRSFTWPLRKFYYKIKMCKTFWSDLYYSWESVDAAFHIPMKIFKEFYEEEFHRKQIVEWHARREDRKVKKKMDEIYQYFVYIRPEIVEISEIYSDLLSFSMKDSVEIQVEVAKPFTKAQQDFYCRNLLKYENELCTKDDKYFKMLGEVRQHMST